VRFLFLNGFDIEALSLALFLFDDTREVIELNWRIALGATNVIEAAPPFRVTATAGQE